MKTSIWIWLFSKKKKYMNMTVTHRLTMDFWSIRLQSLHKQKSCKHWISVIWVISTTLVYGWIIEYGSSCNLIFWSSMFNPWKERGNVRAFPSKEVKFLAYNTSKPKILTFNISLYNTSYIKDSNFFSISFKYCFFFSVSFSLSLPFSENPPLSLQTHTHG